MCNFFFGPFLSHDHPETQIFTLFKQICKIKLGISRIFTKNYALFFCYRVPKPLPEYLTHISLRRKWTEELLETCLCLTLTVIFSMILSDLKDGSELLLFILEAVLDSLQSQESLPSLVAQRIGMLHQTEAVSGVVITQHTVQRATVRHSSFKLLQVLRRRERTVMC